MKKLGLVMLIVMACAGSSNAQILDRIFKKTKEKAKARTENKTDQTIDKGLDKVEKTIDNIFKKKEKETQPQQDKTSTSSTNPSTSSSKSKSVGDDTDYTAYKGSTFVPGRKVLFYEDFSVARLGSGNANWHLYEYDDHSDFERPSIQTLAGESGNWLKMPRKGFVFPNGFKELPEVFTLEFDLYADAQKMNEMEGGFRANIVAKSDREEYSIYWAQEPAVELEIHPHSDKEIVEISALSEYMPELSEKKTYMNTVYKNGWMPNKVNRVSISRAGADVKLFLNGKEMVHLPNGLPKKGAYTVIFSTNMWGDGMYVSNIRIAGDVMNASGELKSSGKLVTNSIYFDTNSARIKPESWSTLNQMALAIQTEGGNYLIVGHTDSDGADEANLILSQKRAESVKNALVSEFGIQPSRLLTGGKGESEPVASNNSNYGKAQNRRVELIKQ